MPRYTVRYLPDGTVDPEWALAQFACMIKKAAGRFRVPPGHHEDLLQEGRIGLARFCQLYRPDQAAFSTGAWLWILSGMRKYVRDHLKVIRTPAHFATEWPRLERIKEEREARDLPTDPASLADAYNEWVRERGYRDRRLTAGGVRDVLAGASIVTVPIVSEREATGERSGAAEGLMADPADPFGAWHDSDGALALWEEGASVLTDRERDILARRIGGGETLQALANDWRLTRERVRQIEALARRKVRAEMERRGVAP